METEKRWYVVHTQTGHEERVRTQLEKKIKAAAAENLIFQILIPTEKVSEVRGGKKKIMERKFFPGYVLVEMKLTEQSWYLIKNTPGITGFIGPRARPQALREEEVETILRQAEESKEKPQPKIIFEKGESVKIIEGPFTNFNGEIENIYPGKGKIKVMVSIFGRSTPVELEYWQVEKV
ncbi:MAG: transcription termination/antitermination protein NusG [Candidatus Omnitrophica bacterium]|nr:transcription termination/antitermination protein NusG [Candidatus Omnitrophota bacterium]MBU1924872.1 transcription termination/antitermination protein NusG [Candidatus Omnitrophota bacterium]